jgi:hypothetical protein
VATNSVGDSLAGGSNTVPGGAYDRNAGNGTVACVNDGPVTGSGFFTISSNHVVSSSNCYGRVVIPEGVVEIDAEAFFPAQNITSIVIANTVTTIGDNAFDEAYLITSLEIPDSVISIGSYAFAYAEELVSLIIGDGVISIGDNAFRDVYSLESLVIGESVETIGNGAFRYPYSLTQLIIPDSVISIGSYAFAYGESLASITLGANLETIGQRAFAEHYDFTSLVIPDSVTSIGANAFMNAESLVTLTIGTGVGTVYGFIAAGAFSNAPALTTINYCGDTALDLAYLGVDPEVTVSCVPPTYTITVNVDINGAITPGTSTAISENSRPVYTITPNTNYVVDTVTVSGVGSVLESLTTVNGNTKRYTFAAVTSNQTLSVTFKREIVVPIVVYVPPTPIPYLKTLTPPKLNLKDGKLVCSPGTYNTGYTLDGVIQGSATALFTPSSFTYNLLINGIAQTPLTVTSALSLVAWDFPITTQGSLITCSVAVSANSLTNLDRSSDNTSGVSTAVSTQSISIASANADYSAQLTANSMAYQKALVDNRTEWRKSVEKNRATYLAELERVKALGANKQTRTQNSLALKTYIASQKQIASNYAASKPAALAVKDAADKVAFERKNAAISEANSTYGSFIESIGYGVLIP